MKPLLPNYNGRRQYLIALMLLPFFFLSSNGLFAQCGAPTVSSINVTGTNTVNLCWTSTQSDVSNHSWNLKVNNLSTNIPAVVNVELNSSSPGLTISPDENGPAPIQLCYGMSLPDAGTNYEAFVSEQCDGNVSSQSGFTTLGTFTTNAALPTIPVMPTAYQNIQQTVTHTATLEGVKLDPSPQVGAPSRLSIRRSLIDDLNALGDPNTGTAILFQIIENLLDVNIPDWIETAGQSLGIPGVIEFGLTPTLNIGIDADYGGFIGISDVSTADVNISYPLDLSITYPEDTKFGCSDKIIIETESALGNGAVIEITPAFYETEMGPIFENARFKIEIGLTATIKIGCLPEVGCAYRNSWNLLDELSIPNGELLNIPIDLPFTPLPTFIKVCEDAFDPSADIGTLLACTGGAGTILQDIVDIINQRPDAEQLLSTMFDATNNKITVGPPDLPSATNIDIPEFDATFKRIRSNDLVQSTDGKKLLVEVNGGKFEELSKLRIDLMSLVDYFGIPTSYSLGFGGGEIDLGDINLNLTTDLILDYELDPTHRSNIDLGEVMSWRVFNPTTNATINSGTSQIVPNVLMGHDIEVVLPDDFDTPTAVQEEFLMNANLTTFSKVMYNNSLNMSFFDIACCDGALDLTLVPEFQIVENEMPGSPKTIEDHTLALGQDQFSKPTESFNLVPDNIPAVVSCLPVTVELNKWGTASIMPEEVYNTMSFDLPSDGTGAIKLVSVYPNTFSCDDINGVEVELVAEDGNCNISTCTTTVTVLDLSPPEIFCPDNFMVDNDFRLCGAEVVIPAAQTSDNCTPTLTARFREVDENDLPVSSAAGEWSGYESDPSGYYPVGRYEIQWRSMDPSGNTTLCSFYLKVNDAENPVISCFDQTIHFNGEETIDLLVDDLSAATDNCAVASLTIDLDLVSCEQLGSEITVTATAVDIYDLSSSCTSIVTVDGLPCGWMDFEENGIGCQDGNDASYDVPTETFTLVSEGCYSTNFTQDDAAYAKYDICGDGELVTRVSNITGMAWAGITMRESEAPGSKKVSLSTNLGYFGRREMRTTTNGLSMPQQFFRPGAPWLKLTRAGNQFVGYMSVDGFNWQIVMTANVPMNACIQVGLFVTNLNAATASASFDQVTVTESAIATLSVPEITPGPVVSSEMNANFELYPNPATQEVFVDLHQFSSQQIDITIYNQMGQAVLQAHIDETDYQSVKIDLNELSAGTYIVEVISGEYRQVKKLLKARP